MDPEESLQAKLVRLALETDPHEAAISFGDADPDAAIGVLGTLDAALAHEIVGHIDDEKRAHLIDSLPVEWRDQLSRKEAYPEETVGRLMDPPIAVFRPHVTVAVAINALRDMVRRALITYVFVTDDAGKLVGVITMRDLLFNPAEAELGALMIRDPFALKTQTPVEEAMRQTLNRHYPVYPVVEEDGTLAGLIRGEVLFREQAIELSAQAGEMVGVEKEERLATPWARSLLMRHPWLQLNLLTAFVAAAVVGAFEQTLDRIVLLAVFLPVLSGQSGNTGCQALAVALRAMTLGELKSGREMRMLRKEALLGLMNGVLVGVTAGLGMFAYASMLHRPDALMLALVVWISMTVSCFVSGFCGAGIPLVFKRIGADPATASSIFLTTATDVVSMGTFLGLATLMVK